MLSRSSCSRAFALALILVALSTAEAFAHCFVGPRFLPATLATDDPCVADELSLPTVQWSKTGDQPPASEWDVSAELSKRITKDLGISIGVVADSPTGRLYGGWIRQSRDHAAISAS